MEITDAHIAGVKVISSRPHTDARGFFVRTMSADEFRTAGIEPATFVQHNQSRSTRGTIRGIHFRTDGGETRIVRCARGAMFDVVVDLRPHSRTFGSWEGFILDDVEHRQVLIPPGCGHAFQALTDWVDTCYQHTKFYAPETQGFIRFNDARVAIAWPEPVGVVAPRDAEAPTLEQLIEPLSAWFGGLV